MKTLASLSAVAVAFALWTGTASAQGTAPAADAESDARSADAKVRVTNQNWLDAKLYLDDDGLLVPLGFVTSQQTAEFTLPPRVLTGAGQLRIVARPIGSREVYVSDNLLVSRGDGVVVTLQNQLGLSTTSVF
jgi:hypothetical protein